VRSSGALLLLALMHFTQPAVCQQPQNLRDDNPQSQLWSVIKRELLGPKGERYFELSVKDARLPGGWNGLNAFEGTLVSSTPAEHPNEFLVAILDDKTPEVTLKLKGRLEKPLPVGTPISFEGVVRAFKKQPFMLTLEVETVNRQKRRDPPKRDKN